MGEAARHLASPDLKVVADRATADGGVALPVPVAGVRQVAAAVTWLTGSLAGLGAILYVVGYYVTLSHLDMLGLDVLAFHYDPNLYIQRGGAFFLLCALDVVEFAYVYLFAAATVLLVARFVFPLLSSRLARISATRRISALASGWRAIWRFIAYGMLILLLVPQIVGHLRFPDVASASDVLYAGHAHGERGRLALQFITSGGVEDLQAIFGRLVQEQTYIGLLVFLAWGIVSAWGGRLLLLLPFAALFLISFTWLPLEFGKLVVLTNFPEVRVGLEPGPDALPLPPDALFLLNKTDGEVALWDARRREVVWLPARRIAALQVLQTKPLAEILKIASNGVPQ